MLEINLLPWRTLLKEKNKKIRKMFLLSIFILIFLLFTILILLNFILKNNTDYIDDLKNQLTELKNQTPKNTINTGMLIIDQIHANQAELIHFFEFLEQETSPEITWITFTSKKNHMIAIGSADSIPVLTHFVNTYHSKKNALSMNIVSIKQDEYSNALQFKLHLMRSISPLLMSPKTHDNI
jgi:magnesium-transporting ATPase (P-type)